jgi:hypothetical protein
MMRNATVQDWWQEPEFVSAAPIQQPRRWVAVVNKIYLWTAAILLPITLLLIMALGLKVLRAPTAPAATNQTQGTQATAQAQVLIEDWLGTDPQPVPGGRIVSFLSATPTGTAKRGSDTQTDEGVNAQLTTYRFVVADSSSRLYQASIQLARSAKEGTTQLGTPALVPIPSGTNPAAGENTWPWPGLDEVSVTSEYDTAVEAWAKAFTSGDPAALKQVVGDPDSAHSYLPLSGVTFTNIQIGQVGALWGKDQEPSETARPERVIARVSVSAEWSGHTAQNNSQYPTITYDLLLDRANTGAPVVVAWGAPGTASLTPYSNAVASVAGTTATTGSSAEPATSSSAEPSATPSPSTTPATSGSATAPASQAATHKTNGGKK